MGGRGTKEINPFQISISLFDERPISQTSVLFVFAAAMLILGSHKDNTIILTNGH
jgi:hypothetical protein